MADKVSAFYHMFQSAAAATGNGMAMDVGGLTAVGAQVVGITSATITVEGTIDDTNWVAVRMFNIGSGAVGTTLNADGLYLAPVTGLSKLRFRISTYATGTITVTGKGLINSQGFVLTA